MKNTWTASQAAASDVNDTLRTLMGKIALRNQDAFEELYDLSAKRMYTLAFRIVKEANLAEEVVSDAYWQVWRRAQQYDAGRGTVMGWLTTICRSRALDALRQRAVAERDGQDTDFDQIADKASPKQDDIILATQRETAVYSALERLDKNQREILTLAFYRGYSHQELADYLELPLGTVKSTIRRAMRKMKQFMGRSAAADLI